MTKSARKKLTARERGYAPKSEIVAALHSIADRIADGPDDILIKFSWNFWYTEDDELPVKENIPDEANSR